MSKTYDELKRAEYARRCGNTIGVDLCIKGDVSANEDLLVDGVVEGLLRLGDGVLTVGAKGRVLGDVVAREVLVFGEVQGNLTARDRIEIKNQGWVLGDLATARIIIEEGANFRGSMEITACGNPSALLSQPVSTSGKEEPSRAFTAAG